MGRWKLRKVLLGLSVVGTVCLFGVFKNNVGLLDDRKQEFHRLVQQDPQQVSVRADDDQNITPAPKTEESTEEQTERVKKRFQQRRALLNKACRMYGNSSLIIPNKKTKFEPMPLYKPVMNVSVRYCGIAKTASTTWSSFLAAIRKHMEAKHVTPSEDRNLADDELYFTFVREPYTRLLSAYVDKLLTPNEMFWRISGKYIVKTFRKNASRKSLTCGHDVTFPEFVKYVIHTQRTGMHRNDHFIPTHDHCDLCGLPYRYIGHLETIAEDMPYITRVMQSPINYSRTYDTDTIQQNANMIVWKDRQARVMKCMTMDEACRRLWKKYQIRGLISKHKPFPYTPGSAKNISLNEFKRKALDAHNHSKDLPGTKAQRTESLREAFAQISLEDKLQLQQTLFLDFQMFGFDPYLKDVFPKEPYIKDKHFSYFDIY